MDDDLVQDPVEPRQERAHGREPDQGERGAKDEEGERLEARLERVHDDSSKRRGSRHLAGALNVSSQSS